MFDCILVFSRWDILAAILGHGSIRVVQNYVHPTAEHKKQAMLRLEQALLEVEERAFPEARKAVN